jgi:hypothetical protein
MFCVIPQEIAPDALLLTFKPIFVEINAAKTVFIKLNSSKYFSNELFISSL